MKTSLLCGAFLLGLAGPAMAENWNTISRSPNNAFMVEVDGIVLNGDVTVVPVATVPRRGEATDYSHGVEIYEIKCAASQWRTAGIVEHGEDGAEVDRIPEEGGSWEPIRSNTLPDFLKQIACDGMRADPPTWVSIKAFVDGGRVLPPI
ncbi:surface-adhesin E family protein [Brevundimonas sp.]